MVMVMLTIRLSLLLLLIRVKELHDLLLGRKGHAVLFRLLDAIQPPVDFFGIEAELFPELLALFA